MNQALISPRKITFILLSTLFLSILLAVILWFWIDTEPVRTPYLNIQDLPSEQIYAQGNINTALERPLFWSGREPVALVEETTVAETGTTNVAPLMDMRLLGIILTGNVRTALFAIKDQVSSVQVGQIIQGWAVDEITAKEVVFVADTEQHKFSLVRERPDSITLELTK